MTVQILGDPWDTISGCTKISAGCKNCYAERFTEMLQHHSNGKYKAGFHKVVCHPSWINRVKQRGQPKTYFVNSMSDTFHDDVPVDFIQDIFQKMNECPQHTFQTLTKRTKRLLELSGCLFYSPNIWQGVSVENSKTLFRIDDLRMTEARVKFVMIEPLVGRLGKIDLTNIDWVIVGGESGLGHRKMETEWVREIRDQCIENDMKFTFKQYSGYKPEILGRQLDGREWNERPPYEWERKVVKSRSDLDKFLEF